MYYVLYNPLSGNKQGELRAKQITDILKDQQTEFRDIREIDDYRAFFSALAPGDHIILAGGDGTINQFINFCEEIDIPENIGYFAVGSGNDFKRDVDPDGTGIIPLAQYIQDLPSVTVKDKTYRFLNNVGFGIDGYCCEVGDRIAANKTDDKPINYAGIAIKGMLFHFKPANAKITVDGVTKEYKRVWLAPAMNGRFYGGGMMISPAQDRLDPEKKISVVVMHGSGKLKTLVVFPSIFKGEHIKHKEMVEVLTGHEITVEFDRPQSLQIDGETILDVTSYTAVAGKPAAVKA